MLLLSTIDGMVVKVPYHHGNLYQTLLDAALVLIGERGPSGFNLREVARRASVSHNAPYRHFESKDHLLAAVAVQGFDQLRKEMLDAMSSEPTPRARLEASGRAYVAFALEHPQHFSAMFDSSLDEKLHPESASAAAGAFEVLRGAVSEHVVSSQENFFTAMRCWSLVHGISKLAIARKLPCRDRNEVLAFTRRVLEQEQFIESRQPPL